MEAEARQAPAATARELYREGLRLFEGGELEEAERCFHAALELEPGRASTRIRLAAARLEMRQPSEAVSLLEAVLDADRDHADALAVLASAQCALGAWPQALEAVDRLLRVRPGYTEAWQMRAEVLRQLGRFDEAGDSSDVASRKPDSPEVQRFLAGAAGDGPAPPGAPREYVQALFDGYAARFDTALVDALNYRAPQVLAEGLASLRRRWRNGLDLGCGTGLCGPLVKPMVDRLVGIDLSPAMLERARARGVYDALHVAEIVEFLRAAQEPLDLVLAADVFIYVGDLEAVFAATAAAMPAGGVFCFSLEEHAGVGPMALLPTRRYAHSHSSIVELCARHGFGVVQESRGPLRDDGWKELPGLYLWLERHGG